MKKKKKIGRFGEEVASSFLVGKGYKIIEKNYRCKFGEIDIIAIRGDKLVFIEVKTRKGRKYGLPEEAVDFKKRDKLEKLALFYRSYHSKLPEVLQIDFIGVVLDGNRDLQDVKHIKNI